MKGIGRRTRFVSAFFAGAAMLGIGGCTGSDPLEESSATLRIRFEAVSPVDAGRFDRVRLTLSTVNMVSLDDLNNQVSPAPYALVPSALPLDLTVGGDATILETRVPPGRYRITSVLIGSPSQPIMVDSDFTRPPATAGVCFDHTPSLAVNVVVGYEMTPPAPEVVIDAAAAAVTNLRLTIDATAFTNAYVSGFTCSGCPVSDPSVESCTPNLVFNAGPVNAIFPSIVTFTN